MKNKNTLIYMYMIYFIFIFFPKISFSNGIKLELKQSIKLNDLAFTSKDQLIKIKPRDGFIIEVKGKKESRIIIELEKKEDNNGVKIIEFDLEKKIIRLNKNGKGTFRIGALIAVKNVLRPGRHYSEVRAKFRCID